MDTPVNSAPERSDAMQSRIESLGGLFDQFTKLIDRQIQYFETGDFKVGRESAHAMLELSHILVLLSQAEEAFYEHFRTVECGRDVDIQALRDQIGSKLDNIRNAQAAGGVSGRAVD